MGQGSIDRVRERSVIKEIVGALGGRTTQMAAVQQGRNVVDIAAGHFASPVLPLSGSMIFFEGEKRLIDQNIAND